MDFTYLIPEAITTGVLVQELNGYKCIEPNDPVIDIEYFSGGFCQTYPLEKNGAPKKCFRLWMDNTRIGDIEHVKQVASYFTDNTIKYVIPYRYYEKALKLNNGVIIPGVVMDWVEGETLINYVKHHRKAKTTIQKLATKFYNMAEYLNDNEMAHGDLSGDNIIVQPSGELCLIDYDSFFIHGFKMVEQPTAGISCYQHVERKSNKYLSKNMDYFSQQVIYLSLLAISKNPQLGDLIGDKELLFLGDDFQNEEKFINSRGCKEIIKINDSELLFRLDELRKSVSLPLSKVQSVCQYKEHTIEPTKEPVKTVGTAKITGTTKTTGEIKKTETSGVVNEPAFKYVYCPNCGTKYYKPISKYCHHCGKKRE